MIRVKKATYLPDYKIKILFSDGVTKIVDFKDWIFEREDDFYLKPLRDIEYFQKFKVDEAAYTICWPNGADFCPDVLYRVGHAVKKRPIGRKTKQARKSRKN